MGKIFAIVLVVLIVCTTAIVVTALSLGYDTNIVTTAFSLFGTALGAGGGVAGGIAIERRRRNRLHDLHDRESKQQKGKG